MSFSDPLDVLKIINIIQNGNWLIVLGFNDKNNNVLIVKSESDLNKDILLKVLDGRIPSIYSFPELHIKIDSKCFSSETLTDTIHNKDIYYEFNEDGCVFNGNIKIVGFPSIAMLQKRIDLTKWVYDNTWIGSLKYFNKKYRCDFEIFGNRYSVETRKKSDLIKDYPVFHNEYTLMQDGILVGDLYLLINPNTDKHCFRHSKYGLLNIETIEKYFWKKFNKFKIGGIEIEIDIKNYEMFTNIGTYDKNNMLRIFNNLF
jgi:hypothetical protein